MKFHIQNKLHLSGLLLLGCFSEAQWRSVQAVWVQMKCRDCCEWLHSAVVFNKNVCCKFLFILASLKT